MFTLGLPGLIKEAVLAALHETNKRNPPNIFPKGMSNPETPCPQPSTPLSRPLTPISSVKPSSCSSEENTVDETEVSDAPKLTVCSSS